MKSKIGRRDFLNMTSAGFVAAAAYPNLGYGSPLAPAGVPTRVLGKTGVKVSMLAIGMGSRFCTSISQRGEDYGVKLLSAALDHGVNYFDSAASYTHNMYESTRGPAGYSERILGQVVKGRRKDMFLATKTGARDRDAALKSVELSLKNLNTDHLDLIQMHSLSRPEDIERIEADNGCLKALRELKEQKIVRFIGVTCHQDGKLLRTALERMNLDTVLMALNAAQSRNPLAAGTTKMAPIPTFESEALPTAVKLNMGIIAMKALAQTLIVGEGPGLGKPAELLSYNLSLPVSTAVVGTETLENLEDNVRVCKIFVKLSDTEMNRLRAKLAPSQAMLNEFFARHAD